MRPFGWKRDEGGFVKKIVIICLIAGLAKAWAASTINSTDKFAYGANIGWLNAAGDVANGAVIGEYVCSGYIWSANCGWIFLSNALAHVQNDTLRMGADSDGDGITDAWERTYTNTLAGFTASTDTDGDGMSDLKEHSADTSPLDPNDYLRITFYSTLFGGGNETNTLTWTTKPTRCYQVDYRTNLNAGTPWVNAPAVFAPDPGMNTTRLLTLSPPLAERYFRIEAIKPLSP